MRSFIHHSNRLQFLFVLVLTVCLSSSAFADYIIGSSMITPSTTLLPAYTASYQIDEMCDGITSDASPFNGFAAKSGELGTIQLELTDPYDLEDFVLWNDINVHQEGIHEFRLEFFDENDGLVDISPDFIGPFGDSDPMVYFLGEVKNVKRVDLVVISVYESEYFDRIEIREVAFHGNVPDPDFVTNKEIEAYYELPELDLPFTGDRWTWDFEDENGLPSWDGWVPVDQSSAMVGNYAHLHDQLTTYDYCCENWTPQVVFLDDTHAEPTTSTVGLNWIYGTDGYILNNSGGVTAPPPNDNRLHNEIQSPVIDLTGTPICDYGAVLRFQVYRHEPLDVDSPGMMYYWRTRSADSAAALAGAEWRDWDVLYYGEPACLEHSQDITDLLDGGATYLQVALGVVESYGQWIPGGADGTPAPYFDNVELELYDLAQEPILRAREIDLYQDSFPAIGVVDVADLSANSIRLDAARNISPPDHLRNDPGDSIICIASFCDGVELPVMLNYQIDPNPLFDPFRTFSIVGTVTGTRIGTSNRYSFDLPDEGAFFPGDVLQYFFQTGGVTLPENPMARGFGDFSALTQYPATYTVRGLPSLYDDGAGGIDQPKILFWNDSGNQEEINGWFYALESLEFQLGVDYDIYSTNCPTAGMGNGLGGRATSTQLEGYETILYSGRELAAFTISVQDFDNDAGDDIGVLQNWLMQGDKNLFLTGGNLIYDLVTNNSVQGQAFVQNWMGTNLIQQDIRPLTGMQNVLDVKATGPVFVDFTEWSICGIENCDCPGYTINAIEPAWPVEYPRAAQFLDPNGNDNMYPYAAATYYQDPWGLNSEVVVLPYDLLQIHHTWEKNNATHTAQALVLGEVLDFFGHTSAFGYPPLGLPDLNNSTAVMLGGEVPISIYNFPNGKGRSLPEAFRLPNGTLHDGTITLTVRDSSNQPMPIAGYPKEDMWLEVEPDSLGNFTKCCRCAWIADHDTDINGETTFTGPYNGGGTQYPQPPTAGKTFVVLSGDRLTSRAGFSIGYNSPDCNADCVVDIADISCFAADYYSPYNAFSSYRSDFHWDEVLNLKDLGVVAAAIGSRCKEADPIPTFIGKHAEDGVLGLYADTKGARNQLAVAPNVPFDVHLILNDSRNGSGIEAWECNIEVPDNVRILEWTLAGQAVNVFEAPEFMVGLKDAAVSDGPLTLATARCVVTDDQPALFRLKPFRISSASDDSPVVVFESGAQEARMAAIEIASGDPAVPVFGVNASDEMNALQPLPTRYAMHANAPNPFNPMTVIRFDMPQPGRVEMSVYGIDGRKVATLVSEHLPAGSHAVTWRGEDDGGQRVASGVYFCRMTADGFDQTQRMVLLK